MDPALWVPSNVAGSPGLRARRFGQRLNASAQCGTKAIAIPVLVAISQRGRRRRVARHAQTAEVDRAPIVAACCDDPAVCSHDNPWHGPESAELLPVTVLSGFLGSGKTTLLKRILRSASTELKDEKEEPAKVAVIVNDMGEVNLDASEIKNSKLIQEEATMVEMHNGCICCTLRGDLLKTVKALSEEKAFDYLVIESTGISEPLPVAQTFTMDVDDLEEGEMEEMEEMEDGMEDHIQGPDMEQDVDYESFEDEADVEAYEEGLELKSLSHFARLDTMVTVVDALNIYDVLASLETLAEKNIAGMAGNDEETDDRSIAQLMLDQIEFANVILLSKVHLMKDASAVEEIRALLQKLNPYAKVIVPSQPHFADVPLSDLINTRLFDMDKAESSAGWMQELAKAADGGHTPETEEYDISSMVFRCHERPFHPGRLAEVLAGFGNYASSVASKEKKSAHGDSVFSGVVRAKGHLWLASADARPIDLHVAGRHVQLGASEMPFLAAVPREEWDDAFEDYHRELLEGGSWHDAHGDRGSILVFIGVKLDKVGIGAALEDALLTDKEMAEGKAGWKALEDPFFGGEYFEAYEHLEEPKMVILEE